MNRINSILLEHKKFYRIKLYGLEIQIDFGKFKGKKLSEILDLELSYINFCLLNVEFFCISDATLAKIKLIKSNFQISTEANEKRIEKLKQWEEQEQKYKNKYNSNNNSPKVMSSEDWDQYQYECMGNEDEPSYDNDNLDMDQQCEEFYNIVHEEIPDSDDDEVYSASKNDPLLIDYAKDLEAYSMSLFKGIDGAFIEINKGKDPDGKNIILETLNVKGELKNNTMEGLRVVRGRGEKFAMFFNFVPPVINKART